MFPSLGKTTVFTRQLVLFIVWVTAWYVGCAETHLFILTMDPYSPETCRES